MRSFIETLKHLTKDIILDWWLPRVYERAAKRPLENGRILFVEAKEDELSDSFKAIYGRLQADKRFHIEFISLRQSKTSYRKYFLSCAAMLKKMACAEVVFLNDASDIVSCVSLRAGTQVVQLWHACGAFKKWGMSTADLKFGGTRMEKLKHPFYENLSLVTVSSPEVVWAYAEAMNLEDRADIIVPTGVSRTDVFFDETFKKNSQQLIDEIIPYHKEKKILLYAPTFRGRANSATAPDELDIAALQEALGQDYILLIKHHPFVTHLPSIPAECRTFAFDVSDTIPIDSLLCTSDICISDYSSLVFEYSLFERPMVFFAYDKDEYDDWRGFYYDYDELTPGPVVFTNAALIDCLVHIDERFDRDRVSSFRERFMGSCDGQATTRILHTIFKEEASGS